MRNVTFFTKELHLHRHSWWMFQPAILVAIIPKTPFPSPQVETSRFASQSFKSGDGWPGCLPVFDKCPTSIFFHPGKTFTPTRRVPGIISLLGCNWVISPTYKSGILRLQPTDWPFTNFLGHPRKDLEYFPPQPISTEKNRGRRLDPYHHTRFRIHISYIYLHENHKKSTKCR